MLPFEGDSRIILRAARKQSRSHFQDKVAGSEDLNRIFADRVYVDRVSADSEEKKHHHFDIVIPIGCEYRSQLRVLRGIASARSRMYSRGPAIDQGPRDLYAFDAPFPAC